MATDNNKQSDLVKTNVTKQNMSEDIHDSPEDEAKMQSETFTIDLPDVSDIPGQENIVVPIMNEMADTTISSDDEEGVGLFGDDQDEDDIDMIEGNDADVSTSEKRMLKATANDMPTTDDLQLRQSALDNTDDDGDELNEGGLTTDVTGGDLDISGADSDDPMEAIGEEDEENNGYSLGSDSNDNVTEGTP